MVSKKIYSVGGTVQASGGLYIQRKADTKLLELCRNGEYVSVLSARQLGKSSLMIHTAEELAKENIQKVIIDLSEIGIQKDPNKWYLGILIKIIEDLEIEVDLYKWWKENDYLGETQKFTRFFRDLLLPEFSNQIVIFFDEIDTALDIPYVDDFLTALRSIFNARAVNPEFKNISFVFIGTASITNFIKNPKRTPFNIGQRIVLEDFMLEEALPLAHSLDDSKDHAKQILQWVFEWTDGHPYLTQKVCYELSRINRKIQEKDVINTVDDIFLKESSRSENNLKFIQDRLLKHRGKGALLKLYADILSGKITQENSQSWKQDALQLSGIVKPKAGFLKVRNKIYEQVFDLDWVKDNSPKNITRNILVAVLILFFFIFFYDMGIGILYNKHSSVFTHLDATSSEKITSFAHIFRLRGLVTNTETERDGREIFYGLSRNQQIELFAPTEISQPLPKPADSIMVIKKLYTTFADTDQSNTSTDILKEMASYLDRILDSVLTEDNSSVKEDAKELRDEINAWINGRESNDTAQALLYYNQAIIINPDNPATRFERALLLIKLNEYAAALEDLDAIFVSTEPTTEGGGDEESSESSPTATTSALTSEPSMVEDATPPEDIIVNPPPSAGPYKSSFYNSINISGAVRVLIDNNFNLLLEYTDHQAEYTNLQKLISLPSQPITVGITEISPLFVSQFIDSVGCLDATNVDYAIVALEIFGGQPPYELTISSQSGSSVPLTILSNEPVRFQAYSEEPTSVTILSSDGQTWSGTVAVPSESDLCAGTEAAITFTSTVQSPFIGFVTPTRTNGPGSLNGSVTPVPQRTDTPRPQPTNTPLRPSFTPIVPRQPLRVVAPGEVRCPTGQFCSFGVTVLNAPIGRSVCVYVHPANESYFLQFERVVQSSSDSEIRGTVSIGSETGNMKFFIYAVSTSSACPTVVSSLPSGDTASAIIIRTD